MSEIQELVKKLAQARQMVEMADDSTRWTKKEIAESELGVKLAEEEEILRLAKLDELAARAELEQFVRSAFDGTDKHPHQAITIKERKVYEYSAITAREWAMQNMPAVMDLNARKFERVIAEVGAPEFVGTRIEHQVTVSTDLSGYLE